MSEFQSMAPDETGAMRLAGGDARMWVKFELKSRLNAYRSEMEGRPIHEPIDYVRIQQPGERDQVVRPVKDDDKMRWPRQWAAYKEEREQVAEGTPVKFLFPNEPHVVELMLDLKIQTVEQLAQVTEQAIVRMGMEGRRYVSRAQAAMEKSEALKGITALEHKLNDANDQIAVLTTANTQLQRRLEALETLSEMSSVRRGDGDQEPAPPPRRVVPLTDGGPSRGRAPPRPERPEVVG